MHRDDFRTAWIGAEVFEYHFVMKQNVTGDTLPRRVCPLLERDSATEILSYAPSGWVLRQCLESGFVFLDNPPHYEAFEEDHAWELNFSKESERRKKTEPVLYAISTLLKKVRSKAFSRHKVRDLAIACLKDVDSPQIHLLDVGCGWGGLLQEVIDGLPPQMQQRCVPNGIELSKELARLSNEKLRKAGGGQCIQDNALDGITQFPPDYFDLIVLSSFLEHEINPLPLLRRCLQQLKPGGRVVIKVPNYASLNRKIRGGNWCGFRWPDHVNYFTPQTLTRMATLAGLQVDRMQFRDRQPWSDSLYAVLSKPQRTRAL
jgi:2-polyprenyl-3-methyl-5-hydroxy-6-metoxy-1,4-benzoquinol methylase